MASSLSTLTHALALHPDTPITPTQLTSIESAFNTLSDSFQATDSILGDLVTLLSLPWPSLLHSVVTFLVDITDATTPGHLNVIDALLDSQFPEIVSSRAFSRLRDTTPALEFFQNVCEVYPTAGPEHLVEKTRLLGLLLRMIVKREGEFAGQESLAASELLAVIVLGSEKARRWMVGINGDFQGMDGVAKELDGKATGLDGKAKELDGKAKELDGKARELKGKAVGSDGEAAGGGPGSEKEGNGSAAAESGMYTLLQAVAKWKNVKPEFPEEMEWCENVYACLSRILLDRPQAKFLFLKLDGVDLAIRAATRGPALKLLVTAVANSRELCAKFVDDGGLKIVFPAFMITSAAASTGSKKSKLTTGVLDEQGKDALAILFHLCFAFRTVQNEDDIRWARLEAKFLEPKKLERLIEIHNFAARHVTERVDELAKEEDDESMDSDAEYLDLLDYGLQNLQHVDVVLAKLICDGEILTKKKVMGLLVDSVDDVRRVLLDFAEQFVVLRDVNDEEDDEQVVDAEATNAGKLELVRLAAFVL